MVIVEGLAVLDQQPPLKVQILAGQSNNDCRQIRDGTTTLQPIPIQPCDEIFKRRYRFDGGVDHLPNVNLTSPAGEWTNDYAAHD